MRWILLALLLSGTVLAQTSVQGTLSGNTTWSSSMRMTGDVTVPAGVTLTINPGVTVEAASSDGLSSGAATDKVELIVYGTLLVNGTASSLVRFKGLSPDNVTWQGIVIMPGSTGNVFHHASFDNSHTNLEIGGEAQIHQSQFSFANCVVVKTGGSATINSSVFDGCDEAVRVMGATGQTPGNLTMRYSVVTDTYYTAVNLYGNALLENNTIARNKSAGVRLASPASPVSTQTLRNNIIAYSISGSAPGVFKHTVEGSYVFEYNDVYGFVSAYNNQMQSEGVGAGNLYVDPKFVGTTDFHLQSTSPMRGAGKSGVDMGAYPYGGVVVDRVTLSPTSANVPAGSTQSFTAQAYDAANNPIPATFSWSATSAAGTITQGGVLTASCTTGSANNGVTVTAGGKSASASVTVTPGTLASITLTPQTPTVAAGGQQQFSATAKDTCNNTLTDPLSWSAQSTAGAITQQGLFTASGAPGNYPNAVTVSSGTINRSTGVNIVPGAVASVTVTPANVSLLQGATQQFSAVARDAMGNVVSTSFTWSVSSGSGAISPSGLFTAGTGPATVRATAGTIFGTASVQVVTINRVEITPPAPSVAAGGTVTFAAQAFDSNNNVLPATFTWSATSAAGTITQGGVLTASCTTGSVANGVTVTAGGKSASATVNITPGGPSSIAISPSSASVQAGATQGFTGTVKDACNNVLTTPIVWSLTSAAGTVSSSGMVTATCSPGSYSNALTATAGGISQKASLTVTTGPAVSLSVQPTQPVLPVGGQQQFTASGADSCANPVSVSVTWSSTPAAGAISTTGLFTAGTTPGSYPAAVTATAGALTKSTDVSVTVGAVSSVTVSPSMTVLAPGEKHTFTAVARDAAGNLVNSPITWSVANGGGTLSTAGEFTAGTVAQVFANTVKATAGGVSGTASVTVKAGPATRVVVTPSTATLAPNGITTFSAQVLDAHDNPTTDTVTWTAQAAAGTITAGGVFTAAASPGNYPNAITATTGSLTGHGSVTITHGALSQLIIAPATATVRAGATVAFSASGKDAQGNAVPVTATWKVLHGGGMVDGTGLFTAAAVPGTFVDTVQASANGLAATATVTVTTGPVVQIAVTPAYPAMAPGEKRQFSAVAKDAFGNEIQGVTFSWSADDKAGTVDAAGMFTAGNVPGDHPSAVVAQAEGIKGSASVRVLGTAPVDAGTPDAGLEDAGEPIPDAGETQHNNLSATPVGCGGCSGSGADFFPLALLGLGALWRRRG